MEVKNKKPLGRSGKADIRFLNDMKEVLYDQKWAKDASNLELYYMYRMLKIKDGLRYDITIIPPKMLGSEFVKTKGHNHAGYYGEVYIVLEGKGLYLFQSGNENKIDDVCAVLAKKGEIVLVPAGHGHVTINPSDKELKMANWVKEEDRGNFSLFEKMHGACYFFTTKGWIKNEKYKSVPKLRFEKPLKKIPKNLDFLKG